jgi:hypothetical protein
MDQNDIAELKTQMSCAALLERWPPVWRLDRAQSSRHSRKYRRGPGEILIVNHDGRGWWDPLSQRKGDVFTLLQTLEPGLSFGAARRVLRELIGTSFASPALPPAAQGITIPVTWRWAQRRPLSRGLPAWRYLTEQRGLPASTLLTARTLDAVREGPHGSAWFAHRDGDGVLTGIEMRGPSWRGFSAGGTKTLFRLPGGDGCPSRLAVCEAAIDALSLAAIEQLRGDTLYVATAGGMGPATLAALRQLTDALPASKGVLVAATDADRAGRRYTDRLAELAHEAGRRFTAILPPVGLNDWNDVLRAGGPP